MVCSAQAYKCTVDGKTVFQGLPCAGSGPTVKDEVLAREAEVKRRKDAEAASKIEELKNTLAREKENRANEEKRGQKEPRLKTADELIAEAQAKTEAHKNSVAFKNLCPKGYVELRIGLTASQVRECVGYPYPKQINKSVYSWGTSEQWVYDYPPHTGLARYMYFRNNVLTSYQQ